MKTNSNLLNGYENMTLYHYGELPQDFPNTVPFEELPQRSVAGVLKADRYTDEGLVQTYSDQESHVGVIAATRLGKTTSYVVPTIISFARQKVKRSLIISDPKGELYRCTSETLRQEGYKVKLLNFRDYLHSECWNPLTPIYRKYQKAYSLEDEVQLMHTEAGDRNFFRGKIYEDQTELDEDIERLKKFMMEDVATDIENISMMISPTINTKDPYWEDSSRELLKAYLWAMLEDSHPAEGVTPITEETYSFSTIVELMVMINGSGNSSHYEDGYFSERDSRSRAYALAKNCILENGNVTRNCIISIFNSKIAVFKESAMRLITSCNTFEMSELTDGGPVAIYIDYRDELKVHYQVISLFVQNAYTYLINYANAKPKGRLDVPFYFILDEFGNFPQIKDFETVISACGGRNVFFILILQSYAQLNNVYGRDIAEIIRDNLNIHVFFGSNNPNTLEEFSRECGQKTRISPLSALNGSGAEMETYQLESVPLMPKSALSNLKPGECIVTEANCGYVLFSRLERYYLCKEFNDLPQAEEKDYKSDIDPLDKKYTYVYKKAERKLFSDE